MKKSRLILAMLLISCTSISNAQSFKEKMKAKMEAAKKKLNNLGQNYETYDYTDDIGISGTYFVLKQLTEGQNTAGFEFNKEENGINVNKLTIHWGVAPGKTSEDLTTKTLQQNYKTKFGAYYFGDKKMTGSSVLEIGKDVYAYANSNGEVRTVFAKDSANFREYDMETAQVLYDQTSLKMKKEVMDKETVKWKKNEVYAKNVKKIVFATDDRHLLARGLTDKLPRVDGKGFKTELDMAGNMYFMAFFEYPPATAYPGQDINIEYEMNGIKTNRVELRKQSETWSKYISQIETEKYQWRQHSPRQLRAYNSYLSRWVQDYAFINLLYLNKGKFLIGSTHTLTVKMYLNRDGENGELIAEGTVKLKYTSNADMMYVTGNPKTPSVSPVFEKFEEFLEE